MAKIWVPIFVVLRIMRECLYIFVVLPEISANSNKRRCSFKGRAELPRVIIADGSEISRMDRGCR